MTPAQPPSTMHLPRRQESPPRRRVGPLSWKRARFHGLALLVYATLLYSTALHLNFHLSDTQISLDYFTRETSNHPYLNKRFPDMGSLAEHRQTLSTRDQVWKFFHNDSPHYILQAEDPSQTISPYRFRVFPTRLAGSLASLLGCSVNKAFRLMNIALLLLAALVFTETLRKDLRFSRNVSILGGILFITMVSATGTVLCPVLDPASFFFMSLMMLASLRRRRFLFVLSAILGVLTKEILIIGALIWLIPTLRVRKAIPPPAELLVASTPLLAFVLVRVTLGHSPLEVNYGFDLARGEFPISYAARMAAPDSFLRLLVLTFLSFGFLWLGVANLRRLPVLQGFWLIIPPVVFAAWVLSGQVTRVLGILYPVVIPGFLYFFEQPGEDLSPETGPAGDET